ncbi:hypothetical protein MCUN1_000170 [Malassezia cuniculi]|uniref:Uncharacterized protein n=1 Tax=Malassezia cuniculi TaxID=948313 RepID=A0AAF0J4D7_9BASI|nr:hypothetical protein MCUN1_000170 [Malassezia cuniculi]
MLNALGLGKIPGLKKSNGEDGELDANGEPKKPYAMQKPPNTALRQQRLKAWQPVLTHVTVLPLLFLMGSIFAVIGGVMYWGSQQVNELRIDYTKCRELQPSDQFTQIPSSEYSYRFNNIKSKDVPAPEWRVQSIERPPTSQPSFLCTVRFSVPATLEESVFLYYHLTNYYQNHRRYLKNIEFEQLMGHNLSLKAIRDGTCKPVAIDETVNKPIYPCGLIANSVFNDTFSDLTQLSADGSANGTYVMSERNIVWKNEKKKYVTPPYPASDVVPPPFWRGGAGTEFSFNATYEDGKVFDPTQSEHFQVWMRTAAFPSFRKLFQRNDTAPLVTGRYSIEITDNYPVSMFTGTKSFIISTSSWMGGRNPVMGASNISVAALCFFAGFLLTAKQIFFPRHVGDMSYLSWNNPRKQK